MENGESNSSQFVDTYRDRNKLELTLQERILAGGVINGNRQASIDYVIVGGGTRINKNELNPEKNNLLIEKYKSNPVMVAEILRDNMFAIMQDKQVGPEKREGRLDRYLDSYFGLIVKMDREVYLKNENDVLSGIPTYFPDGLSDMGGDANIKAELRTREKIRIDKKEIFEQSRELFKKIFKTEIPAGINKGDLELYIVKNVMDDVAENIKYGYQNERLNESVGLSKYMEENMGICRHQALLAQVLLQSFGLESRLIKSMTTFAETRQIRHANNLVKINNQWNLIDVTNSDTDNNGKKHFFIKTIDEKNIDLNKNRYSWTFVRKDGDRINYKTDSNMYYRIVDNLKNPL